MTESLTPAVAARPLGLVAIFQWPVAWAMVCVLFAVVMVWASRVGLTIGGAGTKLGLFAGALALSALFRRRNRGAANLFEAIALWIAFMAASTMLVYLAASCAFPLQDATYEWMDRAIGFDWSTWYRAVIDRPILRSMLTVAYNSMFPQVFLLVLYFSPTERSGRIGELVGLAAATVAVTALISALWPALGPFARHGSGGEVAYLRDLLALRSGGPWHFETLAPQGLVTMPSYHTVTAVLLTYAFRRTGLLGYGIATLNLLMLVAIPPIGGHYLVDVLAGVALACGAITIQRALRHSVSSILFPAGRNEAKLRRTGQT